MIDAESQLGQRVDLSTANLSALRFRRSRRPRGGLALRAGARTILATAVAGIALLGLGSTPALGAFDHSTPPTSFSAGCGEGASITDIAVWEADETILVSCFGFPNPPVIKKFDYDGNPVDFSGSAPYINGNEITADPASETGRLPFHTRLAIDNSSANNGSIFVASTPNLDIFLPSGEFAASVHQAAENTGVNQLGDVDVDPEGHVFVSSRAPGYRVSEYDTNFHEFARLYRGLDPINFTTTGSERVQVDSTGAVWSIPEPQFVPNTRYHLTKYEADQFGPEIQYKWPVADSVLEPFFATPSPFAPSPLITATNNPTSISVDVTRNDLYVNRRNEIETYSQGTATMPAYRNAPNFGSATLSNSTAIAVTRDHMVFASNGSEDIIRFGPGNALPDVRSDAPEIDDIGHTDARVTGGVELAGGSDISECEVEYGLTTGYAETPVPCVPDPAESPPGSNFSADTEVEADLSELTTGETYHYRFTAANASGANHGIDRTVVPAYVLKLQTLPATEIESDGATLNSSMDPDGQATSYYFEYGIEDCAVSACEKTASASAGEGNGTTAVSTPIDEIPSGRVWHYRVVAFNAGGTTKGPDRTFRTASAPDVAGVRATQVTQSSALLNATINPVGYPSEYHFEYGRTPEYGSSAPLPGAAISAGEAPVHVEQMISGLEDGVTYHFRVVASNQWGTQTSVDTTFDYSPPSCPNGRVRQQTRATYLPDCRAYELVSPGNAGPVLLWPSLEALDTPEATEDPEFTFGRAVWPVNTGRATSPPRFSYWGGFGVVTGTDAPSAFADMYLATRTDRGWVTTYPGVKGSEGGIQMAGKQCSESLDQCIDNIYYSEGFVDPPNRSPYLFDADGSFVRRLPTNIDEVPGGETPRTVQRMSGDFSHYVFATKGAVFAPEGVLGGIGSVYDNDIPSETVTVASKLPGGAPIPSSGKNFVMQIVGLSPDGSHILMDSENPAGTRRLYMRLNGTVTFEVSRGVGVKQLVGMTRDGSRVYFVTSQQLTSEDTDESDDLYVWSDDAGSPELRRLSVGNGNGNSDSCSPAGSWTTGCGVVGASSDRVIVKKLRSVPGPDNAVAEDGGDVYFMSPEILDGSAPGVQNQKNLYVIHHGSVQFVSTLDPGSTITRVEVTPDGRHAAFITDSRMLSYDNNGRPEMYTYEPDSRTIECASCKPNGQMPRFGVVGSQGGRFMADDGRVFFATKESVVDRDTDGEIVDVYEYVGGRPQLISSGIAPQDATGGGETLSLFTTLEYTGLEAVSRDGKDVYFSTFDTLTSDDANGEFVKFYDARTGGGFVTTPQVLPCVAADECHGADSEPPSAPVLTSEQNLGAGGNVTTRKFTKRKHRRHRRHRRHRKHRRHRAHRAGRGQ